MKLSYYHIVTPQFKDNDSGNISRILYSTRTGKAKIISNSIWSLLSNNEIDKISEEILLELLKIEAIVPKEENELNTLLTRNRTEIVDNKTLYLVVQPTATCQLGCNYCGQEHTSHKLSEAAQDKFLERTKQKLSSHKYNHLRISWFGAEPLNGLSVMRRLSPKFKEIAKEYACNYSSKIVTNGLSLSKKTMFELAELHSVNYVEITLDGTEKYHNERRHYKNGKGSFEKIFSNLIDIAQIKSPNFTLVVRCNVDRRNFEGVEELLVHLANHNLQKRISFYVAPVHSWGNDAHKQSLTTKEFSVWEINWFARMHQLGFGINLLPKPKKIVCMAVQPESDLIDAHGNLFNCTEVSYVPAYGNPNKFSIGHVAFGEFEKTRNVLGDFNDDIANGKYDCNECRMLPVCGGQCPKLWLEGIVPCPTPKFNIKERLILTYALGKQKQVYSQ